MRLFTTIAGLRCFLALSRSGRTSLMEDGITHPIANSFPLSVGLVPTMGALHAGHLSLIRRARQENDLVVVSIFVNPLQFAPHEDFQRYPRTLEKDQELCQQVGVDALFAPAATELYGTPNIPVSEVLTQVIPPVAMITGLCGRSRPTHFQGVATVVTKLLSIVQPDRAYFGQKDAQQLAILKRLMTDLNLPVEIIGCPIVREADGLAMSSRNRYLSTEERSQAIVLYRSLKRAAQAFQHGKLLREELMAAVASELAVVPRVQLEYVELVHPDTMAPLEQVDDVGLLAIAAHFGSTRLIDNILLRNRKPILAIDGPAGAGKSTVARQVAQTLGLLYLDTGAMYRAVTWLVLKSDIAINDEAAIAEFVSQCEIILEQGTADREGQSPIPPSPLLALKVWINGQDVTQEIRSLEVTAQVSTIAAQPIVRHELVKRQQAYGRKGGIVMDGRDIGTFVFPDAELKIFLTASVQERARRRRQELINQGQADLTSTELEQAIQERDRKDSTRQVAPLKQAIDAIEIQTDNLSIDEVTAKIVSLYRQRLAELYGEQV
ncbi:MAG: bifunctional pantoate--beta-alanine ligase/(d)CMP kinase [Cyanobacteria bacterium CRU_2_1]|nr:bifunctional pantoate--beta-alanine ligase/(d)CMP kinase [Cyanobacteria bacterium RU_5_0]NJR61545.1 bifunctional pantoate--beta-alanine ligase/(d)CMP kinase [Cyanobacteria bacterium CRU_2_1]